MIFDCILLFIVLLCAIFIFSSLVMLLEKFEKDVFIVFLLSTFIFISLLYWSYKDDERRDIQISKSQYVTKYFVDDRYGNRKFYIVYKDGTLMVSAQSYENNKQ